MGIKVATNANENKINNRTYNGDTFCTMFMGILIMSSIAVCLMFQRRNLYIIKVKSLAAIKPVTKTFPILNC